MQCQNDKSAATQLIAQHYRLKLLSCANRPKLGFPVCAQDGKWVASGQERWSDGFWPGLYWLAWRATGEPRFRDLAERQCAVLAPRADSPTANYDLGFLFYYSHALAHALTGDEIHRDVALRAARRMCGLMSRAADIITITYPERIARFGRPMITTKVDVMMNLTLLWWAYAETEEALFHDVARRHAARSLAVLLRDDGSVWELADFDPASGELIQCGTKEGVDGPSCWARAQAWAVYGFLQAARFTGEKPFLDAARLAYRYWHANLPNDGLPYWDLIATGRYRDQRDSSAAAIVLAALAKSKTWNLPLSDGSSDLDTALASLSGAFAGPDVDGILDRACAYYRKGEGVNGATVWGDYYALEALSELIGAGPG